MCFPWTSSRLSTGYRAKLGVPPTLVAVLMALHAKVNVKFSVEGVERTVGSIIGVRQGDLLGPILFNFHVAGALMAWKEARKSAPPTLRTKCDFVLNGRRAGVEEGAGRSKVVRTVRVASSAGGGGHPLRRRHR
jgi:hypothetical protein